MQISYIDLFEAKSNHILVTTNSSIKRNGSLVMGAGAALTAAILYPELSKKAARLIINRLYCTVDKSYEYGCILDIVKNVGIFQVKYNWRNPACLKLIQISTDMLKEFAENKVNETFSVNYPGVGLGNLNYSDVYSIVKCLPDNVYLHLKKWKD